MFLPNGLCLAILIVITYISCDGFDELDANNTLLIEIYSIFEYLTLSKRFKQFYVSVLYYLFASPAENRSIYDVVKFDVSSSVI